MSLDVAFKLSLYSLSALAGWILGAAEEGWIPYGSLVLVFAGYLWSETGRSSTGYRSGMNDTLASVCGFIALTAATNEFFSENVEGRLLSGTHLVVYLTWIVLLQRKTNRRYWLLLALGLLQLAVASVLTSGKATIWFGICAIFYVGAAIWTLSVFSLYRSASQFASIAESTATTSGESDSPNKNGASRSIGSVQNEDGGSWLSFRFATGVAFTACSGLFVSALFFALIPRVWIASTGLGNEDVSSLRSRYQSGFTENVRLGDMGSILESLDPVLQLRLVDPLTRQPINPENYAQRLGLAEPLFRGAVLTAYDSPRWKAENPTLDKPQPLILTPKRQMVRQDIRLEGISSSVLFCMGTPLGLIDQGNQIRASYEWITGIAYRPADRNRQAVTYSVLTELPPVTSNPGGIVEATEIARRRYHSNGYLERNKRIPKGLARLAELAENVVAVERDRKKSDLTDLETVRALETYLRDSGEYTYTINLSVQDTSIDPVEDFLFNRKTGHCEYFATALVLMLRSVGIPARLVTGFKGGDYDESDHVLYVQQRHSHAWCEAWINDRAWITLDATPADDRTASVEAVLAKRSVWNDMRSQLAGIWSDNVVNISLEKQEQIIYRPLREFVTSLGKSIQELWVSPNVGLGSFFNFLTNPKSWFSLRGGMLIIGLTGLGMLAYAFFRQVNEIWSRWQRRRSQVRSRRLIEFYERFARLMKTLGLHRGECQTQHEFAVQAAQVLNSRLHTRSLEVVPAEISNLFYKVRFGNETLPDDEARHVDEMLTRLEKSLSGHM